MRLLSETVPGPLGPVHVLVREGAPSGPLLVACHGYTDSAACWLPLVGALPDDVGLVAVDAPGHGGTPLREGRPLSVPDQAQDVATVLDALAGDRPVVVVGHSMGGAVAAHVAALRPSGVARLVLEDPAATAAVVDIEVQPPGPPETWRPGPTWPDDELAPWAESSRQLDPRHLDHGQDWGPPLREVLRRSACPVLLVHGDPALGAVVDPADAQACVDAAPGGGRVVALPVGHSVRREARAAFVALLADELRAAGRGAGPGAP